MVEVEAPKEEEEVAIRGMDRMVTVVMNATVDFTGKLQRKATLLQKKRRGPLHSIIAVQRRRKQQG